LASRVEANVSESRAPRVRCGRAQRGARQGDQVMPLDLEASRAPRSQQNSKSELPPLLRDYLEYVRGNPEVSGQAPIDYLDRLWRQASEFAERNGVSCPVPREEVEALRAGLKARMGAPQATLPTKEAPPIAGAPTLSFASAPTDAEVFAKRHA
jgi:hypothetical protein